MQFLSFSFIVKRIKTIICMMKDKSVPKRKKALIVAGVIYLLLPIDLIPPIIPILGFLDDFILWLFILNHLREELNKYWVGDDNVKPTTKKYRGKNVINDVNFEVCEEEKDTCEEAKEDCNEK